VLNDAFEKRNPKTKAHSNKEQQAKLHALEDEASINCTVQLNIPEVIIFIIMKLI